MTENSSGSNIARWIAGQTLLGGDCNSSPIACDGHIYASNTDGTTFVVKAGKEFSLVGTNKLVDRITTSPAISRGDLIYRTDSTFIALAARRSESEDKSHRAKPSLVVRP